MSWEWSHSPEAYQAARENVHKLDDEMLAVIWAEWRASKPDECGGEARFFTERYPLALIGARNLLARMGREVVADAIFEKMEELRTCTNGGHMAHCCPFGCSPHMVSFDNPDENEESESV